MTMKTENYQRAYEAISKIMLDLEKTDKPSPDHHNIYLILDEARGYIAEIAENLEEA